jgi:hypothetical protein
MKVTAEVTGTQEMQAEMARIAAALDRPREMFAAAGKHLAGNIREHFRSRDAGGNAKGWPSHHFFLHEGADRTELAEVTDHGATVVVESSRMAHRLRGGTITPRHGRALAIPATAEAYSRWPRDWGKGELFRPRGTSYLASADGQGIRIQYFLASAVRQRPHDDVLPDLADEARDVLDIAKRHIARQLDRR